MNKADVLKIIRDKYPQYDDIPDSELASLVIEKFPQYKEYLSDSSDKTIEVLEEIKDALAGKEIIVHSKMPEIKVPEPKVTVNLPEVKVPEIKIPEIKVPEIKVPEPKVSVTVAPPEIPNRIVDFFEWLRKFFDGVLKVHIAEHTIKKPVPVSLVNAKGEPAEINPIVNVQPSPFMYGGKGETDMNFLKRCISNDKVNVSADFNAADIQIGAVEIKNSLDDTRATVGTNGLHVDPQPLATIYQGSKTVPTGTAEAIATTQTIHSVTVKALSTNAVAVYIGASGVTTANGFELLAGESITLDISNLASVFVVSGSASQVVRYIAL